MNAAGRLGLACSGMAAGLAVDAQHVAPAALLALCAAPGTWGEVLRLHLLAMPCSMTAMLLAPLAGDAVRKLPAGLLAATAMTFGMILGARVAAPVHALGLDAFAALLVAMAGGMALAMALAEALVGWMRARAIRFRASPASVPAAACRGVSFPRAPGRAGR